MFRHFCKTFLPNPFDRKLKRLAKMKGRNILLCWNRGLGDLPLGLYAMIARIEEKIENPEITFLTRSGLEEGFSFLPNVQVLIDPTWKRHLPYSAKESLQRLGKDPSCFDLIIEHPNPTQWVSWQRGKLVPKLKWKNSWDALKDSFDLDPSYTYIGVQVATETGYNGHRDWPGRFFEDLFLRLSFFPTIKILLFGLGKTPSFSHPNVIDLRGKTSLKSFLALVKNYCSTLILPDSGLLAFSYYLDVSFPLKIISLWSDPYQGVLKQAVCSPNPQLLHRPLLAKEKLLASVSVSQVMEELFPRKPLSSIPCAETFPQGSLHNVGAILLAGGQGSRLGSSQIKGAFPLQGKSLFEWICKRAPQTDFPIAVMVSPLNREETVSFFQKHDFFGREIYFFEQEMLPFLSEGKKVVQEKGKILLAPSGNGSLFRSFTRSDLYPLFLKKGIDLLTIVPVENALANPADPFLIGAMRQTGSDVCLKCSLREAPNESMGALVEREGRVEILEYLFVDPKIRYPYSYTGMMGCSLSFIAQMASIDLPIHLVHKKIPSQNQFGYKQESFLFDALPYAKKVVPLLYPKQKIYAPLKSLEKIPSIEKLLATQSDSL